MLRKFQEHGWLIGILVLAFMLRVWALDFALPNLARPDEHNISNALVLNLMGRIAAGQFTLNPDFFYYPSLYLYVCGVFYGLYFLVGNLSGLFAGWVDFHHLYMNDWSSFLLIQRAISAVFGTGTVWVLYLAGRRLMGSRASGLMAAFLMAVTYLHVRDSHFGVTDVFATFWVSVSLWYALMFHQEKTRRFLWLSAMAAGLAASSKYPAGLVAVAPVLAFRFDLHDRGYVLKDVLVRPVLLMDALKLVGIVLGAFLLTSPYILLDYPAFWRDFSAQLQTNAANPGGLPKAWWYHLTFSLPGGLGWPYMLTGLAGMALAVRHERIHWIPVGFALVFYLITGNTHYVFARYMMPILPVMALYTVWLLRRMAGWRRFSRWPRPAVAWVLLLLAASVSIGRSITINALLARPDTRDLARQWLIAHLQAGDAVGIGRALVHVDLPNRYDKYFLSPVQVPAGPGGPLIYTVPEKAEYTRKPVARHEFYITTYSDIDALRETGMTYFVLATTPSHIYQVPNAEFEAVYGNPALEEVAVFRPYQEGVVVPESRYDRLDGFFIPYTGFEHFERPGPEVHIFRVKPASKS